MSIPLWRVLASLLVLSMASGFVRADDAQATTGAGDNECLMADDGAHFIVGTGYQGGIPPLVEPQTSDRTGTTPFYDVVLTLKDRTVTAGDRISASLHLDFVPATPPDRDGIITFTIIDPSGHAMEYATRVVKEGDRSEELSYVVPADAMRGQWTFTTTWTVQALPPMTATEVFTVEDATPSFPRVIGAVALAGIGIALIVVKAGGTT